MKDVEKPRQINHIFHFFFLIEMSCVPINTEYVYSVFTDYDNYTQQNSVLFCQCLLSYRNWALRCTVLYFVCARDSLTMINRRDRSVRKIAGQGQLVSQDHAGLLSLSHHEATRWHQTMPICERAVVWNVCSASYFGLIRAARLHWTTQVFFVVRVIFPSYWALWPK